MTDAEQVATTIRRRPGLMWRRALQARRMRLRYLRNVDPLTIQMVTGEELMELSPARERRILDAGEWQYSINADVLRRPEARA